SVKHIGVHSRFFRLFTQILQMFCLKSVNIHKGNQRDQPQEKQRKYKGRLYCKTGLSEQRDAERYFSSRPTRRSAHRGRQTVRTVQRAFPFLSVCSHISNPIRILFCPLKKHLSAPLFLCHV